MVKRTPHIGVRVMQFGRDQLEELFFLHDAMEGMAARLAAENATNEALGELERLLELHAEKIANADSRVYRQKSADEDFHFAIARASKCGSIEHLLLNEVYYHLRIHRLTSSTLPVRAKEALQEHHDILEALHSRNPARAEETMRHHIRNARYSTLAYFNS